MSQLRAPLPSPAESGKSPSLLASFLSAPALPSGPLPSGPAIRLQCPPVVLGSSGRKQGSLQLETGLGAGNLGSISACDLGATGGPRWDLQHPLNASRLLPAQASLGAGPTGDGGRPTSWLCLLLLPSRPAWRPSSSPTSFPGEQGLGVGCSEALGPSLPARGGHSHPLIPLGVTVRVKRHCS